MTSPETEQAIMENAGQLDERERCVFQKMNEGCTLKQAGASVGVGQERARQMLSHGCRAIRHILEVQFARESARRGTTNRSCGIFALGRESYVSMKRFQRILDFLSAVYHVERVYIERDYAQSGFMMVLKQWPSGLVRFHLTVVTDEEIFSEHGNEDLKARFCPPCDAVSCVSWPGADGDPADVRIIADITGRSDFCIYNSSALPQPETSQQYFYRENQTVFLDVSKSNAIEEALRKQPEGGKFDE